MSDQERDRFRRPLSLQDWFETLVDTEVDIESRAALQQAAKTIVLNPAVGHVLARMEAERVKAMISEPDSRELLTHQIAIREMRDLRNRLFALAQDQQYEQKKSGEPAPRRKLP